MPCEILARDSLSLGPFLGGLCEQPEQAVKRHARFVLGVEYGVCQNTVHNLEAEPLEKLLSRRKPGPIDPSRHG